MLYIDVFRDFCMNGLGGGTRLRYVQMRSRRAGTAHRGRRSAAPARARYRAKTENSALGTARAAPISSEEARLFFVIEITLRHSEM